MKINNIIRYTGILTIILINIGCDQVSKAVVRMNVDYQEQIPFMKHHLVLTKVENSGAFLSLGDSLPPESKQVLLFLLPAAALLMMMFWLFAHAHLNKPTLVALSCIIGGGFGNLYDRVTYGSVTDFLYIHYGFFRTGIFNAADLSIMFGTCFLLISYIVTASKGLLRT
jgi:signal peptidase II